MINDVNFNNIVGELEDVEPLTYHSSNAYRKATLDKNLVKVAREFLAERLESELETSAGFNSLQREAADTITFEEWLDGLTLAYTNEGYFNIRVPRYLSADDFIREFKKIFMEKFISNVEKAKAEKGE